MSPYKHLYMDCEGFERVSGADTKNGLDRRVKRKIDPRSPYKGFQPTKAPQQEHLFVGPPESIPCLVKLN